ncbi:hypothetical protein MRX96_010506 [Rhipicephalus microplus]
MPPLAAALWLSGAAAAAPVSRPMHALAESLAEEEPGRGDCKVRSMARAPVAVAEVVVLELCAVPGECLLQGTFKKLSSPRRDCELNRSPSALSVSFID